jgi:hypothetical protein
VRTNLTNLLSFRAIGVRSWLKGLGRSGLNRIWCGFANRILIRRCCSIRLEVVALKVFRDRTSNIYLAIFYIGFFALEKEYINTDYANKRNKDLN